MKRRIFARSLMAGVAFAALGWGQEFKVGSEVRDFNVYDLSGGAHSFASLKGSTTVVIFMATRCPVSNSYNERMETLYKDYSAKSVKFVFINANATEPPSEVRQHAKEHGFTFPVYKDPDDAVANRFGAQVTPETYVIDSSGTMRYHGSIDDSMELARVHSQRLRGALDAVLAGKSVTTAETKAFGCVIRRPRPTS